jgi:signal transduction histidine kinase
MASVNVPSEARHAVIAPAVPLPGGSHLRLAVALMGAVVCIGAVAVAAAGASSEAAFGRGLLELLIVGTPIAVGLYALRFAGTKRFGIALLGIGFAWSLTSLAETSSSVPFTIGRIATWLTFPCVVYLLLAVPDGRINRGLDRVVLYGVVGVLAFLFIGTAPFVQSFPPKTLWSTCATDCPANALFVLDRQPAFLTEVVLVREWLVELLWLGLFVSMFRRWRAASPLQRRALGPPFIGGALLGVCHVAHITARQLGAPTDTVIAISSAWTFSIVAVCAAFLFALVRRRMILAGALARLGVALRYREDPSDVRDALADALGDPTMELLFRDASSEDWCDPNGDVATWPRPLDAGRAATTIGTPDGSDVVLIHDVALRDDQELLDGVSGMVLAGRCHERLVAELNETMSDLEDSRRRIAEAADLERARIERDLHDGAQQRLIAVRIRLGLVEEQLRCNPAAGSRELHKLGPAVDLALDDLRAVAHGVYPSLLADRGLPDALAALGQQAPISTHVVSTGVTRQPIKIESAVYFSCAEALQNAAKHAGGATGVWLRLSQTPRTLRFEVRDDGPGFTPRDHDGRGLRNMHDRIEAVGGRLTIDARPGHGTRVLGRVDLP